VSFGERLTARVAATAPAVVGIDPHLDRVPGVDPSASLEEQAAAVRAFGLAAVAAVADLVAAVKPQLAFFEQLGAPGIAALHDVVAAARDAGLLVIADAKRGDIGSTAEAYARAILDDDGPLGADAVTLSPYLGPKSLAPFRARAVPVRGGKGIFVLLRTSNPGAGLWQADTGMADAVAAWVREQNRDGLGSVGVVVGATLPDEAPRWRAALPEAWFLAPGFGAQGATAADVRGHFRADGTGALVTASRSVLFPAQGCDPGHAMIEGIRARAAAMVASLQEA